MKVFCKNHRKELAFVIIYLTYVYVACFFFYSWYRGNLSPEYICVYGQTPIYVLPIWESSHYLRNGIWYLPGFFLILAWISLLNQKKWLYGLFTLIVWVNFYFVAIKSFRVNWWIYNIIPVVSLILPLLYVLGKRKPWMFWISNLAVFMTACRWEIRELWILIENACRAKINIFVLTASIPRYAIQLFCVDLCKFIKIPILLRIFYYLSIDVENVQRIILLLDQSKQEWVFDVYGKWLKVRASEYDEWMDYYWFIRVFLLASILLLGIILSYQKYGNQKEKIIIAKKR